MFGLRPDEVWVLYRDKKGFTQARNTALIPGVLAFIKEGALLGNIWAEGYFGLGDPLIKSGEPTTPVLKS